MALQYTHVDWSGWSPVERATLVLTIRDDRMLLIHKKRGLGAGKFNGPGGRIEPGETPLQGAIREVQEELCVTPTGLAQAGELRFQFADGHAIQGYVFTATDVVGEPRETDEAIPCWFPLSALPYHNMWADDRIWMPLVLERRYFSARFLFDGELMLGGEVFPAT